MLSDQQCATLRIIEVRDGRDVSFDAAPERHKASLSTMRDEGLISFNSGDPTMRITEAGRRALSEQGKSDA